MKKGLQAKLLAFALALCLCTSSMAPAEAWGGSLSSSSWWNSLWSWVSGGSSSSSGSSSSTDTDTSDDGTVDLTLVEDETTVANASTLRASTYAINEDSEEDGISTAADTGTSKDTIKYFPVTMYDYDTDAINDATHQAEVDAALASTNGISSLTQWNGIYFNNGNPSAESYSYYTGDTVTYQSTGVSASDCTQTSSSGSYTLNNPEQYYNNSSGEKQVKSATLTVNRGFYTSYIWNITYQDSTSATGYNSTYTLYKKTVGTANTTATLPYATHNFWTGIYDNAKKGYAYQGLVENELSDGNIKFTVPEGGIFTSDTSTKEVYTNVGMPFYYSSSTGTYTFNAASSSTDIHTTTSGIASNTNMTPSTTKQSHTDESGETYSGWFPFGTDSDTNAYHFGMQATVAFSMTKDGMVSSSDKTPITFNFSGDDDVWVFIDGKLVLDLGGIHDSVDGSINFATGATTVSATQPSSGTLDSGSFNVNGTTTTGTITQNLWNTSTTTGLLNTDLETFSATETHQLKIFYLERGKGASNCKIQFNLPIKDDVTVTKQVASTYANATDTAVDSETMESVNNRDFTFTLYKQAAGESEYKAVTGTYRVLDSTGTYVATRTTNSDGTFTLKNTQTAKFIGEISSSGDSYYVVEKKDGDSYIWNAPTYSQSNVSTTKTAEVTDSDTDGQSMTVTAYGSYEAADSIDFICTNSLNKIETPSLEVQNDVVVIDYGLPVTVNVLANDTAINQSKEIQGDVSGAQYGTATVNSDGTITYTPTKQLTGVETLTYTVTGTAKDNRSTPVDGTATLYIVPATSMYYEENFGTTDSGTDGKLVTYNKGKSENGWQDVTDETTTYSTEQQCGFAGNPYIGTANSGTLKDPYGSDPAYKTNTKDSLGTSKYVDTTNGAASFSYTFTGTGTSFFARTTNNSAYLRVVVKDSTGNVKKTSYRDTSYKTSDGTTTLYNIPVYTYENLPYGTYTVTVTVAMKTSSNNTKTSSVVYGSDFWLDGIRVINPLDTEATDDNGELTTDASVASSAYAADGESDMTTMTLRNKLIDQTGDDLGGYVVFTDTNGEINTKSDYVSIGPKEEVYLDAGQSVTFTINAETWEPSKNHLYLGVKAPMGSGTVSVNNHALSINNTADCYYDVSTYGSSKDGTVTIDGNQVSCKIVTYKIENTGSSVISLTNIKVTGYPEFVIDGNNIYIDGDNG